MNEFCFYGIEVDVPVFVATFGTTNDLLNANHLLDGYTVLLVARWIYNIPSLKYDYTKELGRTGIQMIVTSHSSPPHFTVE